MSALDLRFAAALLTALSLMVAFIGLCHTG